METKDGKYKYTKEEILMILPLRSHKHYSHYSDDQIEEFFLNTSFEELAEIDRKDAEELEKKKKECEELKIRNRMIIEKQEKRKAFMKKLLSIFTLLLLCTQVKAQSFTNTPVFPQKRQYDVNITYQPSYATVYGQAIMEKQRLYDERSKTIKDRYNEITQIPVKIFGYGNVPDEINRKCNKIFKIFADDYNSNNRDLTNNNEYDHWMSQLKVTEYVTYELCKEK